MAQPAGPFIGFGADLTDCATSGGTFVTVGHCIDIDTPDLKAGDVDASYVQMPSRSKRFIAKLTDNGEVKAKIIWTPAAYSHIKGLIGTPYFFKIVFPDLGSTASTDAFGGYYKELSSPLHLEDMVMCEVAIKVDGDITFTQGT